MDDYGDDELSVESGGTTNYKFGPKATSASIIEIMLENSVNQQEFMGQSYPSLMAGPSPVDKVTITPFRVVNGLPLFMVYGFEYIEDGTQTASHYVKDKIHEIRPKIASTNIRVNETTFQAFYRLPRYTIYNQVGNADSDVEFEVWGCLFNEMMMDIDKGGKITASLVAMGANFDIGEDTWSGDPTAPVLPPNGSAAAVTDLFTTVKEVKWNDVEFTKWFSMQVQVKRHCVGYLGDEDYYVHIDEEYPVYTSVTISCSGLPSGLIANWKDKTTSGLKTFILMLSKGERDSTEVSSEAITAKGASTITITSEGTLNEYQGMELHVLNEADKHERYYISSNTAATPAVLTITPNPASDLDVGDLVEIVSGDNRYLKLVMESARIAAFTQKNVDDQLTIWGITILGQDVKWIAKDWIDDAVYDQATES
jgi:hypothetical protein